MAYAISLLIPCFILVVLIVANKNKLDVLKLFTDGVFEGLNTVLKIFPYILSITIAITLLHDTGALSFLIKPFENVLERTGVPLGVIPLALFRPLSGGASMSIVMDVYKRFGPDSIEGKIASIIMGGTETTLYVTTILFGVTKIKKTRGVIIAALIADFTAILMSIILVNYFKII